MTNFPTKIKENVAFFTVRFFYLALLVALFIPYMVWDDNNALRVGCKECNVAHIGANPKKDTEKRRENFPRSHSGCKECNVALCEGPDCWRIMHADYVGCRQSYSMKYWMDSDRDDTETE